MQHMLWFSRSRVCHTVWFWPLLRPHSLYPCFIPTLCQICGPRIASTRAQQRASALEAAPTCECAADAFPHLMQFVCNTPKAMQRRNSAATAPCRCRVKRAPPPPLPRSFRIHHANGKRYAIKVAARQRACRSPPGFAAAACAAAADDGCCACLPSITPPA